MPYGDDRGLRDLERKHAAAERRVTQENEQHLRQRLRTEFKVPPEFEDLAVQIWWAGKED